MSYFYNIKDDTTGNRCTNYHENENPIRSRTHHENSECVDVNNEKTILDTLDENAAAAGGTENDEENDDDDGYFADVGFMFEKFQPTHLEEFEWHVGPSGSCCSNVNNTITSIRVAINCANDIPGAVQSGHYLWPGARYLVDYLLTATTTATETTMMMSIQNKQGEDENTIEEVSPPSPNTDNVVGIIELGAGCSLVSLFALQYYHRTVQCVLVTDHDPGTLVRASDNYEITLQRIINYCSNNTNTTTSIIDTGKKNERTIPKRQYSGYNTDDAIFDELLNSTINTMTSIPVLFEHLEWGCDDDDDDKNSSSKDNNKSITERLWYQMSEHISTTSRTAPAIESNSSSTTYLILGSDLIYCSEVVMPLFETVATFCKLILQHQQQQQGSSNNNFTATTIHVRFVLSQSFVYDEQTEQCINDACTKFHLLRSIQVNDDDTNNNNTEVSHNNNSSSFRRIQEFTPILT